MIFFYSKRYQYTTFSYLSVQQSNYHAWGAVDDLMHCCSRPLGEIFFLQQNCVSNSVTPLSIKFDVISMSQLKMWARETVHQNRIKLAVTDNSLTVKMLNYSLYSMLGNNTYWTIDQ